jgi:hypothetical protein
MRDAPKIQREHQRENLLESLREKLRGMERD